MTESEVRSFKLWFDSAMQLVLEFINDYDSKDGEFSRGLTIGWIRGLIAGMERMVNGSSVPSEMANDCRQAIIGLTMSCDSLIVRA